MSFRGNFLLIEKHSQTDNITKFRIVTEEGKYAKYHDGTEIIVYTDKRYNGDRYYVLGAALSTKNDNGCRITGRFVPAISSDLTINLGIVYD